MKKPFSAAAGRFAAFFSQTRTQFLLGLLVTLLVTLAEVVKWKQRNFFIYRNATLDLWAGRMPYGPEWTASVGPDAFLYGPLFTLLFTPFAWLPPWLGPFAWNIGNFLLFFYAIRSLPLSETKKTRFYFFVFLMMANNLMYYQYNLVVASIFLLAYAFLEKGRPMASILLIGVSGFTKIYGVFQYAFLLFYQRTWRNVFLYVLPTLLILALLPLVMLSPRELLNTYTSWISSFPWHFQSRPWMSVFHIRLLFSAVPVSTIPYQLGALALLSLLSLWRLNRSADAGFRAQTTGIMMGWVILFSNSPEIGTYLIAMTGLALWYYNSQPVKGEKILFALNFFLFMIVPQDVLCPKPIMRLLIEKAQLHLLVFLSTWLWMIWKTYGPKQPS